MRSFLKVAIFALVLSASAARAAGWEYRIVRLYSTCAEAQLAALGRAGWEIGPPINRNEDSYPIQSYIFKAPAGTITRTPFDLSTWLDSAHTVVSSIKAAYWGSRGTLDFGVLGGKPVIYMTEIEFRNYEGGDRFLEGLTPLAASVEVEVYTLQQSSTGERSRLGRLKKPGEERP